MMYIDEDGTWEVNGNARHLIAPSAEWIAKNQPTKTVEELQIEAEINYKETIVSTVRSKYTLDDELAIIRKKLAGTDTKNEFDEYNTYVESCKLSISEAMEEIEVVENLEV